jgi:thiol-disulfide isomerase/thioredoxin
MYRSLRNYVWTAALALVALWIAPPAICAQVRAPAPEITAKTWLNSEPRSIAGLKGKVVLVEFWTFGCYNCQNVEPYVKQWHQKYSGQGLVIVGVHAPEFGYERVLRNVKEYVRKHGIQYAVAIDNDFAIWKRYNNRYWPAIYLVDKAGIIRYVRIGEGGYRETETQIQALLAESSPPHQSLEPSGANP